MTKYRLIIDHNVTALLQPWYRIEEFLPLTEKWSCVHSGFEDEMRTKMEWLKSNHPSITVVEEFEV